MGAVLWGAVAYLIGTLPTQDARRFLPGRFAAATLAVLELCQGLLAVALTPGGTGLLGQALSATAVLAGRQWPPTGARPGLGLAVAAGAVTVVTPIAVPLWLFGYGIGYVAAGYPAVGRMVATLLLPISTGIVAGWTFGLALVPCCVMVLDRERPALRRVLLGTEPKHLWRREG